MKKQAFLFLLALLAEAKYSTNLLKKLCLSCSESVVIALYQPQEIPQTVHVKVQSSIKTVKSILSA